MIPPAAQLHYRHGKTVSDSFLAEFMEAVTRLLGRSTTIHSGDRDFRPKGSPSRSLHLAHRAADFHVAGIPDAKAFKFLWLHRSQLPTSQVNRYQILYHGPHTHTEGEHIHIGHYHLIKSYMAGPGITFWTEGVDASSAGKYRPYEPGV